MWPFRMVVLDWFHCLMSVPSVSWACWYRGSLLHVLQVEELCQRLLLWCRAAASRHFAAALLERLKIGLPSDSQRFFWWCGFLASIFLINKRLSRPQHCCDLLKRAAGRLVRSLLLAPSSVTPTSTCTVPGAGCWVALGSHWAATQLLWGADWTQMVFGFR